MIKVLLVILMAIISSCSTKNYTVNPALNTGLYCIKEFYFDSPEVVLKDLLYKAISDAILSSGGKIECSENTDYNIYYSVNGMVFTPIGYSPNQRANVYVAQIDSTLKITDSKDKVLYSNKLIEKVQYTGTGMRADYEKRYAFVELSDIIKIRIYSILTSHGN